MAYRRGFGRRKRRFGYYGGLHGQRKHRQTVRGRIAHRASRNAYRKMIRKPKSVVVKAYANTVGQIAYREGRSRPLHTRRAKRNVWY